MEISLQIISYYFSYKMCETKIACVPVCQTTTILMFTPKKKHHCNPPFLNLRHKSQKGWIKVLYEVVPNREETELEWTFQSGWEGFKNWIKIAVAVPVPCIVTSLPSLWPQILQCLREFYQNREQDTKFSNIHRTESLAFKNTDLAF